MKGDTIMAVTSLNVANYFVKKSADEKISLTPMKLQKLVYILYKEYLKRTGQKLFAEKFQVWRYGPVEEKIYQSFKKYGSSDIQGKYAPDNDGNFRIIKVEGSLKDVADMVWNKHKTDDGVYLSMLTHQNNTAWSKGKAKQRTYLLTSDIKEEVTF